MPDPIVIFFKLEMQKFAAMPDAWDRFTSEITLNQQWRKLSLDMQNDIRWHFRDMIKESKRKLPAKRYAEMGTG